MPMLPLPLPMLSLMSAPFCTPSASPLLDAKTVKGLLFPVLKDPTSDTYLLLLLLPQLKLLLLLKLKGRREKLRLSPQLWPRLMRRLTPRPTHGYTIAVSMVDISAMEDTDMDSDTVMVMLMPLTHTLTTTTL